MIGIIAAVTTNGVIGVDNKLPFDYPEDMKHFRKTTTDSVVIMGRKTFEGIGRPLPKRRNIVVSENFCVKRAIGAPIPEGIEIVKSVEEAMSLCQSETRNIWFIGGASIYEEGMKYADEILLTQTPDYETRSNTIKFPWINPMIFGWQTTTALNEEMWSAGTSKLMLTTYHRIK
jgi:dihydrofolate reductase